MDNWKEKNVRIQSSAMMMMVSITKSKEEEMHFYRKSVVLSAHTTKRSHILERERNFTFSCMKTCLRLSSYFISFQVKVSMTLFVKWSVFSFSCQIFTRDNYHSMSKYECLQINYYRFVFFLLFSCVSIFFWLHMLMLKTIIAMMKMLDTQ